MRLGENQFEQGKSRFLSVDKDFALIANKLLENQRLLKMLYYTQNDCLKGKNLTPQQKLSLINKQIKIVPKIYIDQECPIYIVIGFDNFTPNATNPEFRDCTLTFDIICHPDHWNLGNFALRPYKIAGEIDSMLDKQKLTGIGETHFYKCENLVLDDQLMGVTLTYICIHGIEDQINPLVPDE